MIRCTLAPQPLAFEARVEQRGQAWLRRQAGASGRPPDYWSEFRPDLATAFADLCAYSAIYEPVGTVDHFVSWQEDPTRAYDWSNYRFASGWLNSSKSSLRSDQLVDPFEVGHDWFEILLPSLQLVATDRVPSAWKQRVATMLERLHLGHDERIVRVRREWYRMYQEGELSLEGLEKKAPLIAAAIRKRDREG